MQTRVDEIKCQPETGFNLNIQGPDKSIQNVYADFICIATGGSPMASGFDWLSPMGIEIESPVPSLFTFNIADKKLHELMGVSVTDVAVKIIDIGNQERGSVLITHWGLSGPAVLKMSSRAARDLHKLNYDFIVRLNWVPTFHESSILQDLKDNRIKLAKQSVGIKNPYALPNRLWNYLLDKSMIFSDQSWTNVSSGSMNTLAKMICADEYQVQGKTTFKEEFVTAGGIKLECINQATMESNLIKGLYFAGEVLNVDGITGGYNFQHAWASGWTVANAVSNMLS
jgi:predicted Rossmann fold flavoprotein